jgi:hypothetical protein
MEMRSQSHRSHREFDNGPICAAEAEEGGGNTRCARRSDAVNAKSQLRSAKKELEFEYLEL